MNSFRITLITLSIAAAVSANATGVNQNGNSNANSQTTQPHAPIDAAKTGATYNNGVGIGITQGNVINTVSTAATGIGGTARQQQKQKQQQRQKQNATASNANAQNVNVEGPNNSGNVTVEASRQRIPVATAYAAGLTATGACLGSASGGIQTGALGISVGKTVTDEDCTLRNNAQQLWEMGLHAPAVMLLCKNDDIREAMTATGRSCEKGGEKVQSAPGVPIVAPVLYTAPVGTLTPPAATFVPTVPTVPARQRAPREDRGALSLGGDVYA